MYRAEVLTANEQEGTVPLHIGLAITMVMTVAEQQHLYLVRELSEKHRGKSNIITETVKMDLGIKLETFWKEPSDANRRMLVELLRLDIARALSEEYGLLPIDTIVMVAVELYPVTFQDNEKDMICLVQVLARLENSCQQLPTQNYPQTNWEVASGGWHHLTAAEGSWQIGGKSIGEHNLRDYGSLMLTQHLSPSKLLDANNSIDQGRDVSWDMGDFLTFKVARSDQYQAQLRRKLADYHGTTSPSLLSSRFLRPRA